MRPASTTLPIWPRRAQTLRDQFRNLALAPWAYFRTSLSRPTEKEILWALRSRAPIR